LTGIKIVAQNADQHSHSDASAGRKLARDSVDAKLPNERAMAV